jgi:hypothetical protein
MVPTILQYLEAHQCIDPIQLSAGEPDRFIWRWTSSSQFSSKSAYTAMFVGESAILGAKELWRTRAPNKCRFFIWLSILGRCWTSDRLFRHGLRDDNVCTLCCQGAESVDHLLLQCVFSREVWFKAFGRVGWQHLTPVAEDTFALWWVQSCKRVLKDRQGVFDSFVVLIAWCLWCERNARVFRGYYALPDRIVQQVSALAELWCKARLIS